MFVFLSEVIQQHTAAAYGVVGYVVQYGIDACFITGFPFFIDFRRKVDALRLHTFARVYYIRCLFVGDVIYDMQFGKVNQQLVDLPAGKSRAHGERIFVDIGVVCKYPCIGTEYGLNEFVHVFTHFAQPVKFVPAYGKEDA